jgi:Cellulose binding domain
LAGKHAAGSSADVDRARVWLLVGAAVTAILLGGIVARVMLFGRGSGVSSQQAESARPTIDPQRDALGRASAGAAPPAASPAGSPALSAASSPATGPPGGPSPATGPSGGPGGPSGRPSLLPSSVPLTRPSGASGGLRSRYMDTASTAGDFSVRVVVRNPTTVAQRWRVTVRYPDDTGVRVVSARNAEMSRSGDVTVFTGGPLPPRAVQEFGFEAVKGVPGPVRPASCRVNGVSCAIA